MNWELFLTFRYSSFLLFLNLNKTIGLFYDSTGPISHSDESVLQASWPAARAAKG